MRVIEISREGLNNYTLPSTYDIAITFTIALEYKETFVKFSFTNSKHEENKAFHYEEADVLRWLIYLGAIYCEKGGEE